VKQEKIDFYNVRVDNNVNFLLILHAQDINNVY
jgi:hypothetical protein